MNRILYAFFLSLALVATSQAAEATVQYRIFGLFDPQRAEALRTQIASFEDVRLVAVDYERGIGTFAYPEEKFPNAAAKPEMLERGIRERFDRAAKGSFRILPLSTFPREKWQEVRIAVAGHDCKGCNFGLYRAVASLDGVERAVASFKEGHVTAWIDPGKTNRQTLVDELRKRDVTLLDEPSAK